MGYIASDKRDGEKMIVVKTKGEKEIKVSVERRVKLDCVVITKDKSVGGRGISMEVYNLRAWLSHFPARHRTSCPNLTLSRARMIL